MPIDRGPFETYVYRFLEKVVYPFFNEILKFKKEKKRNFCGNFFTQKQLCPIRYETFSGSRWYNRFLSTTLSFAVSVVKLVKPNRK